MAHQRIIQTSDLGGISRTPTPKSFLENSKALAMRQSKASSTTSTHNLTDSQDIGETSVHDIGGDNSCSNGTAEEPDAIASITRLAGLREGDVERSSLSRSSTSTLNESAVAGASPDGDLDVGNMSVGDDDIFMTDVSPSQEIGSTIDEDDYTGAAGMSEDDEEEADIDAQQEEQLIREYETEHEPKMLAEMNEGEALARRLSLDSVGSCHSDFDFFNLNDDPFGGLHFMGDPYQNMLDTAESGMWRLQDVDRTRQTSQQAHGTQKRVRFEDPAEQDSSIANSIDSEDANGEFPDLFQERERLEPHLLARIDADLDCDFRANDGSDAGSYWDYDDPEELIALQADQESESDESSTDDSDDGDTTDEDVPPPPPPKSAEAPIATPHAAGNAPSTPAPASVKRPISSSSRKSDAGRPETPKLPKIGTFILDPTRATIRATPTGQIVTRPPLQPAAKDRAFWKRMAQSQNSTRHSSPRGSQQFGSFEGPDGTSLRPVFTAHSTLATSFDGRLDQLSRDTMNGVVDTPLNAFVPSMGGFGSASYNLNSADDDSDNPFTSAGWHQFEDLVDLSGADTEEEENTAQESDALVSPITASPFPYFNNPASPTRPTSSGSNLLEHLDRQGVVGSFRRNQNAAKHLGSLPSHPGLRASTSEKNALQSGRRAAANTPMTPARKKRIGKNVGARGSPISSPLAKTSPKKRSNSFRNGVTGRR